MAKQTGLVSKHKKVHKRTKQGGHKKTASMSKHEKRSHKKYIRSIQCYIYRGVLVCNIFLRSHSSVGRALGF